MRMRLAATIAFLLAVGTSAAAEMVEKTGRFNGLNVTYKVVMPANYSPEREYPVVLVFTGGGQQLRGAEGTLRADWQVEAERRGYVAIAPGTPNGELFFEGAARIFPAFLDGIMRDYKVKGGKLHIAGHSNGGLSAFYVATLFPKYFSTVTGYPGLLNGVSDPTRIEALKSMCVFMHVGELDPEWQSAMKQQYDTLRRQGYKIAFTVEPKQIHRLRAADINLSPRLFNEIESCAI